MSNFEEFQDLSDMGYYGGKEEVAPEKEFFHSVYIAGKTRKNHINVEEIAGKFQVRGVQYNLENVHMIITHTKDILCKVKNERGKESVDCFSFKEGSPWKGTSIDNGQPRVCPTTSGERASNSFCSACRAQIIIGGIFCEANGKPILGESNKPIFVFIRGKGTKYMNVSNYLNERFKEDLSPIFTPVTEETKRFEKSVVNNKRFVTKLNKGKVKTQFGNDQEVFVLEKGIEIPADAVMKILKLSKDTVSKFNEKFDWSKRKGAVSNTQNTNPGILKVEDTQPTGNETNVTQPQQPVTQSTFSFDDIDF